MSQALASMLQATLLRESDARQLSGANAEVFADGVSIWRGGAGVRAGATFPIYSITKTFTAVAALRLALPLDEPIERWLPNLPFARRISLRQLLNHTAGVFNYSALPEYHEAVARAPSEPWSFDEFVERTCGLPLDFEPGCGWNYSNTGYTLAKRILELETGRSFASVIRHEVATPAQLDATFALESVADLRGVAPGDSALFSGRNVQDVYHPGWCGTGLLASTTKDTCSFFEALFAGRLLQAEALAEMLQLVPVPGNHPPAVTPSYGLGVTGDPDGAFGMEYGHGGGGPGWNLRASHFPDVAGKRTSVAVFCAHDHDHADPIARALLRDFSAF